jgi:twitching motility two-component system response regulator PilH
MAMMKKILIVEDSPTELYHFSEMLERNGFLVLTAESGEEAIVKASAERPDVILMDIIMPGVNGFQATRTLSRNEATRNIPIIICTSKSQAADRIWGLRQGAKDYLTKPVAQKTLIEKIRGLTGY